MFRCLEYSKIIAKFVGKAVLGNCKKFGVLGKTEVKKKKNSKMYVLLYFLFKLYLRLKMHTVPVRHAMFAVHCWVNLRPLNSI